MKTEERLFSEGGEEILQAAGTSKTVQFLDKTAKSRFPKTHGFVSKLIRYYKGEADIRKDIAEGISGYATERFPRISAWYGPKVFGRYWDPKTFSEVAEDLGNYVSNDPKLEHIPAKYGEIEFDGKVVWAKQDGKTAYYISDPEKALGKFRYNWIKIKTGLSKERLDEAVKTYLLGHEEVEAGHQSRNPSKIRLDEADHGKIHAYTLKSLKELGKYDAYNVGVHIDIHRNDIFGREVRKHATPDVNEDFARAERGYALAPA